MFKHSNPVRLGEERVRFDVLDALLHVAESLGLVDLQQIRDHISNVGAEGRWKSHLRTHNVAALQRQHRANLRHARSFTIYSAQVRVQPRELGCQHDTGRICC